MIDHETKHIYDPTIMNYSLENNKQKEYIFKVIS